MVLSTDVVGRAYAAYARGCTRTREVYQQPESSSGVVTVDGRAYVVLRNSYGLICVYRIKTDGLLRRLKRWPAVLD